MYREASWMVCPVSPLNLDKNLDLRNFHSYTYFQAMTTGNGIKACLDVDETTPFTMSDWPVVQQASANFDPEVYQQIISLFVGGQSGVEQLVGTLAGNTYTPLTLTKAIEATMQSLSLVEASKINLNAVICTPFLALASGAGTLVRIDDNDYCYHVCYQPNNVKSGRSFGASPGHNSMDPTDKKYLEELGSYLDPNQTADPSKFYQTIFQALTQCNSSGWVGLLSNGATVATDFAAIYTAELDRNLMTGLTTDSWEDDLAELTLIATYITQSGMVFKNGQLSPGQLTDYLGSTGSIGETSTDRHTLQSRVCQIENSLHTQDYQTLANLIGAQSPPNWDLIHQVMVFLNNPAQQANVVASASPLTNAAVQFLSDIRSDASQITTLLST